MTVDIPTYNPGCGKRQYYYQAVEMDITTTGWYRFSSLRIDIYTLIYSDRFNPRLPFENILAEEQMQGDSCYGIRVFFHAHRKYVKVVRVDVPNKTRPFVIRALGPERIAFRLTGKN